MRGDDDDRHGLVDQRDRAVLEFAGWITFRVDVADLLELQGAFQRQRKARAAAEIEHVLGLGELPCQPLDLGFEFERLVRAGRARAIRLRTWRGLSLEPRACRASRAAVQRQAGQRRSVGR